MDWLSNHWPEISSLVAIVLSLFSTYKVRKLGK